MESLQIALYVIGFLIILILTQDLHIFPGALTSKIRLLFQRIPKIPSEIESKFILTKDGRKLEIWKYRPESQTNLSDYVAIIFHGNGGPLENFLFIQMWFAELGIRSYGFDYRGYGRSSGWPSESGIYLDSDAVWEHVLKSEDIEASKIIVVGISVGGAPAARIASMHAARLLLLSSAFTDLKSTVRAQPVVGILWPFIRYRFPTIDYVRELKKTDLLIAHSSRDNIVPSDHSEKLEAAYRGTGRGQRLTSDTAGHNLAFYDLKDRLRDTVLEWLS
jgi:uncharacterized protein